MVTCCRDHLAAMVRNYAKNANNNEVTVKPIDPLTKNKGLCEYKIGRVDSRGGGIFCAEKGEFNVRVDY